MKRYKNNVGKYIGGKLYVHRLYAHEVIPDLHKVVPLIAPFQFNCVVYDHKNKTYRFDSAENFDTAREPCAGEFIEVKNRVQSTICFNIVGAGLNTK